LFAQLSVTYLAAGARTITAQDAGDTYYAGTVWNPPLLTIAKSTPSASSLNLNPTQPLAGQPVVVSAVLNYTPISALPAPTGSVTFSDFFQGITSVIATAPLSPTSSYLPAAANVL